MIRPKFDYLQQDPFAVLADTVDQPTAENYSFLLQSGNAGMMPEIAPNQFVPDAIDYRIDTVDLNDKKQQNVLTDNGGILSLPMTDKTSMGIFESLPFVRSGSVLAQRDYEPDSSHRQEIRDFGTEGDINKGGDSNPIQPATDEVVFNDPAAMGLQTYLTSSSPLQTTMTGQSAYLSGTDPLPVSQQDMTQDTAYEDRKPSDCGTFDFACKWKSVNQEVYLFIIGAIILAIGIYALTR